MRSSLFQILPPLLLPLEEDYSVTMLGTSGNSAVIATSIRSSSIWHPMKRQLLSPIMFGAAVSSKYSGSLACYCLRTNLTRQLGLPSSWLDSSPINQAQDILSLIVGRSRSSLH